MWPIIKKTVEVKIDIPLYLYKCIVEANSVEAETPFEFDIIQQIRNRYNFNEVEEITDGN
jgi:hypothetical protein